MRLGIFVGGVAGAIAGCGEAGYAPGHASAPLREFTYGTTHPTAPSAPAPATTAAAELPATIPLQVHDMGSVAFLTSVARDADPPDDAATRAAYAFGEPLYAEITLPSSGEEYRDRYGMDAFEVELRFAQPQARCSAIVPLTKGRVLTVALLRDARIAADADLTDCLLTELPRHPGPARWSAALLELSGRSQSPVIRPRSLARDSIDLGIERRAMDDQLERYAIVDRRLRKQIVRDGDASSADRFPSSKMPDLDFPALAAVTTGTTSRRALRAVITSHGWEYARDVKTQRARSRFVVGLAYYQTAPGTCSVENETWSQRIDATPDAMLTARGNGRALPVPCDKP